MPPATRSVFARVRFAASVAAVGLLTVWIVGQLFRDVVWVTGLCFYIPSVVIVVVMVTVASLHTVARRRRSALLFIVFAFPPLAFVGLVENQVRRETTLSTPAYRLMHWNTGGRPGRPGIGEYLTAEQADLYV